MEGDSRPVVAEAHWLMIAMDVYRFRDRDRFRQTAEELLAELRACPPAPGFERVEIPGERERDLYRCSRGRIAIPEKTWRQILALHERLGRS